MAGFTRNLQGFLYRWASKHETGRKGHQPRYDFIWKINPCIALYVALLMVSGYSQKIHTYSLPWVQSFWRVQEIFPWIKFRNNGVTLHWWGILYQGTSGKPLHWLPAWWALWLPWWPPAGCNNALMYLLIVTMNFCYCFIVVSVGNKTYYYYWLFEMGT